MQITFTPEQGQVLVNLLNIANKAVGLEAAESCLFFTRLLQEAAKKEAVPAEEKAEEAKSE